MLMEFRNFLADASTSSELLTLTSGAPTNQVPAPEPASAILLATAMLGTVSIIRRRK
jgi:hypothetical protein